MKGTALFLFSALALALSEDVELNANGCPADYEVDKILPHDTYCNLFYKCAFGERVEQRCPDGLRYNEEKEYCDWSENVDCANKGIYEFEKEDDEEVDEEVDNENNPGGNGDPSAASEICAQENSDGVLVANENCNQFYKCDKGSPVPLDCPAGLLYNWIAGYCDWPFNVDCGDRVIPSDK